VPQVSRFWRTWDCTSIWFRRISRRSPRPPQIDLTSADMRTQPIFAVLSCFRHAPEEAALVRVVHGSIHLANADGCFDGAVIPVVVRDRDLAGPNGNVLIAGDLLNLHLSRKHPHGEARLFWNLDADLGSVSMPHMLALNGELAAGRIRGETQPDATRISGVVIAGRAGNMDRLFIGANDLQAGGTRIDTEDGSRVQRCGQSLIAGCSRLRRSGESAAEQNRACNGNSNSHPGNYGMSRPIVPGNTSSDANSFL
jgi:hypothetical protein